MASGRHNPCGEGRRPCAWEETCDVHLGSPLAVRETFPSWVAMLPYAGVANPGAGVRGVAHSEEERPACEVVDCSDERAQAKEIASLAVTDVEARIADLGVIDAGEGESVACLAPLSWLRWVRHVSVPEQWEASELVLVVKEPSFLEPRETAH